MEGMWYCLQPYLLIEQRSRNPRLVIQNANFDTVDRKRYRI